MAVFVDLDEEENEPPQNGPSVWNGLVDPVKPMPAAAVATASAREEAHEPAATENPNRNSMTRALGCYP
jgi:hypothetical protein